MKHFILRLLPLAFIAVAGMMSSCSDDDQSTWEKYSEWRQANVNYYEEQKYLMTPAGENLYTTLTAPWNSGAEILIRYLNDRSKTEGNLSPMLTSTVAVKYIGRFYSGEAFDSSYSVKPDSTFTTGVSDVISGWTLALQYMRVGDSVRVVLPYSMAYGSTGSGSIYPYSTLVFDIKLKDIVDYEEKP